MWTWLRTKQNFLRIIMKIADVHDQPMPWAWSTGGHARLPLRRGWLTFSHRLPGFQQWPSFWEEYRNNDEFRNSQYRHSGTGSPGVDQKTETGRRSFSGQTPSLIIFIRISQRRQLRFWSTRGIRSSFRKYRCAADGLCMTSAC